jgi:site-specific recombinase XerD
MLGVGTYLTGMRHTGRRTKGTHYLFTTRNGTPLSVRGCNAIFETIKENYPDRFDQLSPHVLRHTWAEEAAHDLIGNGSDEESAINMLRKAGRWKKGSEQPMHYAQKAIEAKANERLRDLHRTFYDT